MRSGRTKITRKMRFILTHSDTGRVSRKTGLPASYLSRVKKGKIKTVDVKVERKLSRMYESYWKNRLHEGGVTDIEAEGIVASNLPVRTMENVINENIRIAELLVKNRNRRDKDFKKFDKTWHTVDKVLKNLSSLKMESWTITEWQLYAKRTIAPALNRGKYYESPEHKKWGTRRRRK